MLDPEFELEEPELSEKPKNHKIRRKKGNVVLFKNKFIVVLFVNDVQARLGKLTKHNKQYFKTKISTNNIFWLSYLFVFSFEFSFLN